MNRIAVAQELVKLAKMLTAAEIDWKKKNRIERIGTLSSMVSGEEDALSSDDIVKANRALVQAEQAMVEFGRIALKGKRAFGHFKSDADKLEQYL